MGIKSNYRDYCNPHPRLGKDAQIEAFGGKGTVYIEDRTGKVIDELLKRLRPGDVVRVVWPSMLAPIKGYANTRRKKWAERADIARSKKACIMSISPPLKGNKLAMAAGDEISNLSRGRIGSRKKGRPNKVQDEVLKARALLEWQSRRHKTRAAAAAAVSLIVGKRCTASWCYNNFGLPSGKPE